MSQVVKAKMTIDQYLEIINREPLPEMVKAAMSKDKKTVLYHYIPKHILEQNLRNLYGGKHSWDMERDTVSNRGAWGKGVLTIIHPVDGTIVRYSGTASVAMDRRMQLTYPALEAKCMINAARKIGPWFGQNLNLAEDNVEIDPEPGQMGEPMDDDQAIEVALATVKAKIKRMNQKEAAAFVEQSDFKYNKELKEIVDHLPA